MTPAADFPGNQDGRAFVKARQCAVSTGPGSDPTARLHNRFTIDIDERVLHFIGNARQIGRKWLPACTCFHPKPAPPAGFLRVGHTGQNKLAALHAAGRFPHRRVVFEAAHIDEQFDLLKLLRNSGCEIVIDLNFAEMGTVGRYRGAVSSMGKPGAALGPGRFYPQQKC